MFLALHLPYLPASLEDLDSINFALGMRQFDVAQHQPHPPGYPVFIALAKGAHQLIRSEATSLAAVSLVAAALCVMAMAALFRRIACDPGNSDGWAAGAAAIAMTSPMYWFTAVRPLSDATGLAAAVGVQALTLAATTDRARAVAAFCAGLAAGIRSQVVWLTLPLLVVSSSVVSSSRLPRSSGIVERAKAGRLVRVGIAFIAGALAWFIPLVIVSGGPAAYWRALSSQGAEDLSGIRMLWTTPTLRVLIEALYYAFVAPWAVWPVAAGVLALAALGILTLLRRSPRALAAIAVAFGPYLIFDLLFQETFTTRYALPLVIPVVFLAVAGLRRLPLQLAIVAATVLAMFDAHVGGRSIAAYARQPAPAFRMLADMRAAQASMSASPVLAPDRRLSFDLRRPLVWFGEEAPRVERQLPAPPQHEWLEAVKYWNSGGRAPVWFVVDPRRAAIDLIQHGDPVLYGWSVPQPVLLGGIRPNDAAWYRVDRPEWYVGEGWSLTPESAGVARVDRRGLEFGPISAWIRTDAVNGGAMVIGGRSFESGPQPVLIVTAGRLVNRTIPLRTAAFLDLIQLPQSGSDASVPDYVELKVSSRPPARVAIEQFDLSAARGLIGFGDGWHEREFNPATGRQWRWLSDRGELRYTTGPSSATLRIEGESPRTYYSRDSRLVIRAGGTVLKDVVLSTDFVLDVPLPAAAQPATLSFETDQIHVPAERSWRGSQDRRRLGLRIFTCKLVLARPHP